VINTVMKKFLIKIIQGILWLIDSDHRIKEEIDMDDMKKFTDIQNVSFESDFGHVSKVFRTIPYEVWELKTTNHSLYGADKHRVINENHECIWMQDLKPGDKIKTDTGIEEVISSKSLNIRTHMYCIQVDTEKSEDINNHLYYGDGILSHNTTCAAAYIIWRAMFVPDQTILIVANKQVQALEIMDRIRYAYETLPDWLRAGVREYNKGTLTFDNGSQIVSRATAGDAGRGLSISLLYADEFAFVRKNIAHEFWSAILPTLSTGGDCIVTSTPNSDEDLFAELWFGAAQVFDENGEEIPNGIGRNGFKALKVKWDAHPERGEDFEKKFRSQLGDETFEREFNCLLHNSIIEIIDCQDKKSQISIGDLFNKLKFGDK